uniref:Uncharacterized protein n=1 Tax=Laticauda laticaudata TaxID=8630 RepID=A0A8C5SLG9_LATLA
MLARSMARELSPDFYQPGPEYLKRRLLQELMENEENVEHIQETPPVEETSPATPPESPQDDEQEFMKPKESPAPTPSPSGTPPESKRAKQGSQKDGILSPGNWNGDHTKNGNYIESRPNTSSSALLATVEKSGSNSRPASQSPSRPSHMKIATDRMEIKPLERIQKEGEVKLFEGYHSYAVRTSPVTPPVDNEEEPFSDSTFLTKSRSPEPEADVKAVDHKLELEKRESTPVTQHEPGHKEKKIIKTESKLEPKQHPPEPKVEEKVEAVNETKPEAKMVAKTEPKTVMKKVSPPETATKEVVEKEEVNCFCLHSRDSCS